MSKVQVDKVVNVSDDGAPQLTYGAELPVGYGLTGAGGLNITGVVTAASAVFSGNVTIGGTLTYEDVTNIDVVGVSTFAGRMNVNSTINANEGIKVIGVSTLAAVTGTTGTFSGAVSGTTGTFTSGVDASSSTVTANQVTLSDTIEHSGDSNTKIRFPAADTVSVETAGSERLRITGDGPHLLLGGTSDVNEITETSSNAGIVIGNTSDYGNGGLAIINTNTGTGRIYFGDGVTNSAGRNRGQINYYHNGDYMMFATAATERLRIASDGDVIIGGSSDAGYADYADNLTIHDTQNSGITIRSGIASQGAVYFSDATGTAAGTYVGNIIYDHSDNHMRFATSATERLRIDTDGRVLIGAQRTYDSGTYYDDITINNSNTASGAAGGAGISLVCGATSYGGVIFSNNSSHGRGYMKYDMQDDQLVLGTQTIDRVVIEDSTNNGDVHIKTGNIVIDTDGRGINFAATGDGNGTDSSELLADYEEGTWTPANTVGLTLVNNNTAYYVKVGKLVTVWFDISFRGYADSAQCSQIQGLPYAASSSSGYHSQSYNVWYSNTNSSARDYDDDNTLIYINGGDTTIRIWSVSGGHVRTRSWAVVDSNTGRRLRGTMTYMSA